MVAVGKEASLIDRPDLITKEIKTLTGGRSIEVYHEKFSRMPRYSNIEERHFAVPYVTPCP